MTLTRHREQISPLDVHPTLARHMLADGMPLVIDLEHSHGSRLVDARDGRELLDLFTCYSTCPVGYNHPKLDLPEFRRELLPAALNKPSNSDLYSRQMAEFVATFARTLPEAYRRRTFYIEGGALAVENALKAAFDWKVRKNLAAGRGERGTLVIHFQEAFHGRSGYTLSLTNTADPRKIQYFPKFDWPRVSNPKLSFPVTDEEVARVREAERRAIGEIEEILVRHPHDVACLIIEPIQGEGGDNHFRGEFLRRLRELADDNEFLLVFDEIQTGFGTTGKWWCFEHFDVQPDIFAFGKKSQICGIAALSRLDEVESVFRVPSRINSTWGGNLTDMVRCRRYVEIIEEDELLANAARVGEHLLAGLRRLADDLQGQVDNARGRGLFVAFDLPDRDTRREVLGAMTREGVLGLPAGTRSIRFRPALTLSLDEADEGLRRVERALRQVLAATAP